MKIGTPTFGEIQVAQNVRFRPSKSSNTQKLNRLTLLVTFAITLIGGCGHAQPRPGIIVGSSMSPNLLGDHYFVTCSGCGFPYACDIEQANERPNLVCPNCGSKTDRSTCPTRLATSVEVQMNGSPIERWDTVAFRLPSDVSPNGNSMAGVKRVVGLPGETIEFRDGQLFSNGCVVRKTIDQQKAIRIPIHDSHYALPGNQCWFIPADSDWRLGPSFQFQPNSVDKADVQWIEFQNRRNYSHESNDLQAGKLFPIEDFYAFNQSLSRDLNPMDDVFVALETTIPIGGILAWQFNHRGEIFEFQIQSQPFSLTVSSPNETIESKLLKSDIELKTDDPMTIEFSSFDLRLLVWVNGKKVFCHELTESEQPVSADLLKIGAANRPLVIERIRIWRDLYYMSDQDRRSSNPTTVAEDGYYVLGDNLPISIDSRHWKSPTLPKANVIGKVISW